MNTLILLPPPYITSKRVQLNQEFLKGFVDIQNLMDSSLPSESKSLGGIFFIRMYVCACTCIHVYMYVYVCTYVRTHIPASHISPGKKKKN